MIRVVFAGKKLKKDCESGQIRGPVIGRKVIQRINELCASRNLGEFMRDMPHLHCHKLEPKSEGRYAVTVTGNYRLILVPVDASDRAVNLDDPFEVTAVKILDVQDYH